MSNNVEEFLAHYGVKGMQWGVRRSASQLSRVRSERKQAKKDVRTLRKINRKGGKGVRAKAEEQKKVIESRSKKDPAYARKAEIESKKTQADIVNERVAKAQLATAGALFLASSPSFRKGVKVSAIATARVAGKGYRATQRARTILGESETQKFLRRNAFTPAKDLKIVDTFAYEAGVRKLAELTR